MAPRPDRLTTHFLAEEFACHDGTPVPDRHRAALFGLCRDVLEPMRREFGVCTVVSGYRPSAYNHRIGGAARSVHMFGGWGGIAGVAADVRFAQGRPLDWHGLADALLMRHYPPGGGLGLYAGGWVHVDTRHARARWSGAA
jgi:uncharacterized protein YcbK (DUF882 family)